MGAAVVMDLDKEASRTREWCVAKNLGRTGSGLARTKVAERARFNRLLEVFRRIRFLPEQPFFQAPSTMQAPLRSWQPTLSSLI